MLLQLSRLFRALSNLYNKVNSCFTLRYLAYEELSKEQQDKVDSTLKRLRNSKARESAMNPRLSHDEEVEKCKHSALIGQLK